MKQLLIVAGAMTAMGLTLGCTKTAESAVSCMGAEEAGLAPLPVSRAPFARSGAERQPVKMVVTALSYQTNLWQGVEFVSGTKRLIMSGINDKIDGNNPLRFGRLCLLNDRTYEAELVLVAGDAWSFTPQPNDKLVVDEKNNRATWSRPWTRPDGKKAIFSYTVTGRADGTAVVDWDFGLSLKEALAQTNMLAIGSRFMIDGRVAPTARYGFGDRLHEMYSREKLLAEKKSQIFFMVPNSTDRVINFEKDNELRHWAVTLPACWAREVSAMDYAGQEVEGKIIRGTTYHYNVADFRNGNPKGFETKGRVIFDFGKSALPRVEPKPAVGGMDFWGFDAVHVPVPPTRNWIQNGSFEQGLKGWRWEDWGANWSPAEKYNEEVVEGGKFGRHALILRNTQQACPELCSAPMPLVAGKTYTISCWIKAAGPNEMSLFVRPRSVNRLAQYAHFKRMNEFKAVKVIPGEDWKRHSLTITMDAGGLYVQMRAVGSTKPEDGVLIDGVQVEEGTVATDFAEAPFVADLLTTNEYNDLKPGEPINARLDVQALTPETTGSVKVTVKNGFFENVYEKTFNLKGDAVLPLELNAKRLGTGVFIVGMDYESGATKWSDYARFIIQAPLANKHATSHMYANHNWYHRVSRGDHFIKKFVEWGWASTDGACQSTNRPIHALETKLGLRNYVHPVSYHPQVMRDVAKDLKVNVDPDFHVWTKVTEDGLRVLEEAGYREALECDPTDNVWTCWNEEEGWARAIGYDEHFKCVAACMKGVRRAFKERGLPPPRFSESHGLSHYFRGRNYDEMEGYLTAAGKKGVKYDVVTAHPYANIDGGVLSSHDADLETQNLMERMKRHGYSDDTPIMYTECFNMLPMRIPPWGADGWGDSYRQNTVPSQDLGERDFIMAASQMRLYLIYLKFWPKVQLVHCWNAHPILDMRFTPWLFVFSPNIPGHLLPDPEFVGDAQPYGDVRGYCFRQKQADGSTLGIMPIWTTNLDVEWGVKESPIVKMALPKDVAFIDMFGNRRAAPKPDAGGYSRVPLTPAPLFLISRNAPALLRAVQEAIAEDPSVALSPDVRPDEKGQLNLVLRNETKARQQGEMTVGGATVAYDIAPRGEQTRTILKGETTPMKLQSWKGSLSILPKPWETAWFFVPKCGEKPNWSTIASIPFSTALIDPGGYGDKPKAKGNYKLAWNKDYLFVRVEVEDPEFVTKEESGEPYASHCLYAQDGGLEVCFDAFADARRQGEKCYDENDSRYDFLENAVYRLRAVNWQLAQGVASASNEEIQEKLIRKFTRTAKGYVYEIAFAARYLAPIDLKPGTVAGVGIAFHDWNGKGKKRTHATISNVTRQGQDCNEKPYLWPLMVLGN